MSLTWLHVHVGGARNAADAAGDLAGDFEILILVAQRPGDLHVDGRGQTEVQNLPDDVGGLEEKRQVGIELRQAAAQLAHVFPGGAMLARLERNQHLRRRRFPA